MHIEDLIEALVVSRINIGVYNDNLLFSMHTQIESGLALTEKQSKICLRLLGQHSVPLSAFLCQDITNCIVNPTYRYPFRIVVPVGKRLSVIADAEYVKAITIEFPYNNEYIAILKKNSYNFSSLSWDRERKHWKVPLTEKNILFLDEFARRNEFQVDAEFQKLAADALAVLETMDTFVPMLAMDQGKPTLVNVSKYVPELVSTDLVSAVFESRKLGVITWDSKIAAQLITHPDVVPCIQDFLNSDPGSAFYINAKVHTLNSLGIIIRHLSPCLVILPGGSELEKLIIVHEMLSELGIGNDEITVLFRLASSTGSEFNLYIREHLLNGEISNHTKVVFISGKVPKPLVRSKVKFHSAINLGFDSAHYSMRRLVASQENLINFSEANLTRLFNFDDL